MLIIPLAMRLAPILGMVDQPDPRKVHHIPVPRVGGWGIVIGSIVPLMLVVDLTPAMQTYLVGSVILFAFGTWDDAKQINHWKKFIGQIVAVGLVIWYGDLWISRLPFMGADSISPMIGKPFTLFAMIGMINAINHSDGLDGLAGGETLLSLIVIAFLTFIVADTAYGGVIVTVALAVIGGILGFLRYNTHPARVFMGDAGSQFLGFTAGFLAIYLTQIEHPALSPALPALFLGLPIMDIIAVLVKRIRGGMNWFAASRNHIHHRLLDLGFSHYETVVIIYSVQAVLVGSAVAMRYQHDALVLGLYFSIVGALFALLHIGEKAGWRAHKPQEKAGLERFLHSAQENEKLKTIVRRAMSGLVMGFVVTTPVIVENVPRDFGLIGIIVAVFLLAELLFGRGGNSYMVRGSAYVAGTFSVYLLLKYPPAGVENVDLWAVAYFAVLALLIAITIKLSKEIPFNTTPTDYLILFGVLVLATFAQEYFQARETCIAIINAIVLLYGCELRIAPMVSRWNLFNTSLVLSLSIMGFRALMQS